MTDLTGITITPGVMPAELRESLELTVERMGAKLIETVRIDTTHFVCTEGRGSAWEKALEMNVAVVTPDWVKGCEREGRLVGVRGYYLNADPKLRQMGPGAGLQRDNSSASLQTQQQQRRSVAHVNVPRTEVTPPTPDRPSTKDFRAGSRDGNAEGQRAVMSAVPQPQGDREQAPSPKPQTPVERSQTPPAQMAREEEKPEVPAKDETAQAVQMKDEVAEPSREVSPVENGGKSKAVEGDVNESTVDKVSHEASKEEGEQVTAAVEGEEKEVVDEVQVNGDVTKAEQEPTIDEVEVVADGPSDIDRDEADMMPTKTGDDAENVETASKKSKKSKKSKQRKATDEQNSTPAASESFDDVAL